MAYNFVLVSVFRLSDAPFSWSAIHVLWLGRQLSRFALRDYAAQALVDWHLSSQYRLR